MLVEHRLDASIVCAQPGREREGEGGSRRKGREGEGGRREARKWKDRKSEEGREVTQ